MKKKKVLGRGLDEIFGEVEESYKRNMGGDNEEVVELRIDEILPNPFQPRKVFEDSSLEELGNSIREYGLLQPILVYKEEGKYHLIAGERRLRASKLIKKESIRAIVAEIDLSKLREIALIENIQREDLNPIDLANAYEDLIKTHKMTHEELAERIQKSRAQITNTLRLLHLIPQVQELLVLGKITQGHAKILVALDHRDQEKIGNTIIGQKLSVRATEDLLKKLKNKPKAQKEPRQEDNEELKKIQEILKKNKIRFIFHRGKIIFPMEKQEDAKHFLEFIAR